MKDLEDLLLVLYFILLVVMELRVAGLWGT